MKNKTFISIAIRIIILFGISILHTFIFEFQEVRDFFGDVQQTDMRKIHKEYDGFWIWGIRHYWYHFMMVILFILAGFNLGIYIRKILLEELEEKE